MIPDDAPFERYPVNGDFDEYLAHHPFIIISYDQPDAPITHYLSVGLWRLGLPEVYFAHPDFHRDHEEQAHNLMRALTTQHRANLLREGVFTLPNWFDAVGDLGYLRFQADYLSGPELFSVYELFDHNYRDVAQRDFDELLFAGVMKVTMPDAENCVPSDFGNKVKENGFEPSPQAKMH